MRIVILAAIAWLVTPWSAASEFDDRIAPILKRNCLPCHDERTHSSGLDVTNLKALVRGGARHGQAVKPGEPDGSPLLQSLQGKIQPAMPLGKKLSPADLAAIESWIRTGKEEIAAALPKTTKYWAFVRPAKANPPVVKNDAWPRNDIDRFILAKLEEKGLSPSPEADRRTQIRRVYADLLGVPPTPAEVKAFVADASPNAYEALIDKLLADPRYGERWGRHWLDLARYADTNGYEEDTELTHAWRYRDYVVDAFNSDKPYDEFVAEQLAGDEWVRVMGTAIPEPNPEKVVALTFLRLAPFNKTPVSDENRDSILSEMTSTVSSVFLGMTVGCAKCHDHKYDQIPQKDFYRMKAFFATLQISPGGRIGGVEPAAFYKKEEKAWAEKRDAELRAQIEVAREELAAVEAPLLAKLKASGAKKTTSADLKRALDTELNNAQGFEKNTTFTEEERNRYAAASQKLIWLEKALVRVQPRAWSFHNAEGPPLGPSTPATHVQIRGEFDRLGEAVEPGFLSAVEGHSKPAALELDPYRMFPTRGRRMTLAHWIASTDNPLTARVMVNRLWAQHFGRGIVETTSDFGRNGAAPTHPELLDWLAVRFMENKWSIKSMHRLMMLSGTYRQTSKTDPAIASKADPENRLLWRFNGRRLEGEAIRDSILFVSGKLNSQRGGPPVYPPMPKGVDVMKIKGVDTWETSHTEEINKRSLYIFHRRSLNYPFLETLDAAVPNATCDRRRPSVTSLQSLSMYNSEFVNDAARTLAERVARETGSDMDERIRHLFELTLSRAPRPEERQWLKEYLNSTPKPNEALAGIARVVLNTSEFIHID